MTFAMDRVREERDDAEARARHAEAQVAKLRTQLTRARRSVAIAVLTGVAVGAVVAVVLALLA